MVASFARLNIDVIEDPVNAIFLSIHTCVVRLVIRPVVAATGHRRLRTGTSAHFSVNRRRLLAALIGHHRRCYIEIVCREVWLQLLEQDEDQRHLVFLWQVFYPCLFDFLNVQVQVFVWLQNVGLSM